MIVMALYAIAFALAVFSLTLPPFQFLACAGAAIIVWLIGSLIEG